MSSNPYRNNRNSYRRKRQKDGRVLVALVVVTIMAAGIMGLYGVINLFTDDGASLKRTQAASSIIQTAEDGNNASGQSSDLQAGSTVAVASKESIETKPDNSVASKKTGNSRKECGGRTL